jgi:hypothetical protein
MIAPFQWTGTVGGRWFDAADWQTLLDSGLAIDPYFVWEDLKLSEPCGRAPADTVPLVLEYASSSDSKSKYRYQTLEIDRPDLARLIAKLEKKQLNRFQLGAIREFQRLPDKYSDPGVFLEQEKHPLRVLGVIDDGCPFAHPAFAKPGVEFLWDQGGRSDTAAMKDLWLQTNHWSYGAQLGKKEIREAIEAARRRFGMTRAAEEAVYESLGYSALSKGTLHGVGVLHAAAGEVWWHQTKEAPIKVPIVFVQFPRAAVTDTSGGWLGYYALDGIDYIIDRARFLKRRENASQVDLTIVLSYGGTAGSHDGDSMLEEAIGERLEKVREERELDVHVLLAAGNNYGKRVHASRTPGSTSERLKYLVRVPPDKQTDTFVEFWLPASKNAETVDVRIHPPGNCPVESVGIGSSSQLCAGEQAVAIAIFPRKAAQSRHGSMVLLAIGPTRGAPHCRAAPSGIWKIEIAIGNEVEPNLPVHAWIERDDLLTGIRRGQQAHFEDDGSGYVPDVHDPHSSATDEFTLSGISSTGESVVVGGYRETDGKVADYSSSGPARTLSRIGPDFSAPSDLGVATRGVLTGGCFAGTTRRMSGTSVAAPLLARRLVNDDLNVIEPYPPPGTPAPWPRDPRMGQKVE